MPDRVRCSGPAAQHERLRSCAFAGSNLLHVATGGDRAILVGDRIAVVTGICIAVFDQKPVVAAAAVALAILPHAHQHPAALELLARKGEFQLALAKGLFRFDPIVLRRPEATIPYHDGATAILSLRNRPFKVTIVERMILDLDSQAAIARAKRRSLGDSPGLEDAIHLQPHIVMKPRGGVFLNDKAGVPGRLDLRLPARLRGDREVAL